MLCPCGAIRKDRASEAKRWLKPWGGHYGSEEEESIVGAQDRAQDRAPLGQISRAPRANIKTQCPRGQALPRKCQLGRVLINSRADPWGECQHYPRYEYVKLAMTIR